MNNRRRSIVAAVAIRPWLWLTAIGTVRRLAPDGWWRRPPFLPLPPPEYLEFRLEGVAGYARGTVPPAGDVLQYLRWCRRWPGRVR